MWKVAVMRRCLNCPGPPAELTIIEIELRQKGGEHVASAKRVDGTCTYCQGKKKVNVTRNAKTCAMCENLRSSIRQRPEMVVEMLREIAPQVLPDHGEAVPQAEVDAQVVELERAVASCTRKISALEGEAEISGQTITRLREDMQRVRLERKEALDEVERLNSLGTSVDLEAMKDLAGRLAICVLRGEVRHICADDVGLLIGG